MFIKTAARNFLLIMVLSLLSLGTSYIASAGGSGDVKSVSIDQICGSYMDEPMSADNIYRGKTLKTTIEVSHVRKVHSLCSDAPRGTFTIDAVMKNGTIVQCFCNAPIYQSVLHSTPRGSQLTIQGEYKSLTASFFESESKQCTLTLMNCSFK